MGSRIEFQFVPAPGRDHVDQRMVNTVIERLNVNNWTPIDRTTREHCAHMRYVHRLLQLDEEGEEIEDENLDELEDLSEEDTPVDSPWIWEAHDSNNFWDHTSADEMTEAELNVRERAAQLASLRESPITNETVRQMFEHHRLLQEHGIPAYHPSAPPHVRLNDEDEIIYYSNEYEDVSDWETEDDCETEVEYVDVDVDDLLDRIPLPDHLDDLPVA